jgi:hypothetical protein
MFGWPASRPRCCLKFGVESVAWAETERTWRGRRRHRCVMSAVPEGAVKPSPVDLNLSDLAGLEGRIQALTGPGYDLRIGGRVLVPDIPRPIAVLLPDAAVRAVVLHLDKLPAKREERDALIRWRLSQEQLFPLTGAKVVSQVFSGGADSEGPLHTVLAVAVQDSVLNQYESLCTSLGLIPRTVAMTSLQLFELWRRASGARWQRRAFLWANVADNALTTMVFQQGRLLFYRCKLLGSDVTTPAANTALTEKIVQECGASLDACQQRHPRAVVKEVVLCADGNLSALHAQVEAGLDLSVEQLGWGAVEGFGWVTKGSQRGMASLAAMAGVS